MDASSQGEPCTRREAVGLLAGLLGAGLWPGALAARAEAAASDAAGEGAGSGAAEFAFVVVNDMHHLEPACDPWMQALFTQVAGHRDAAFCLLLGDISHAASERSLTTMRALAELTGMPVHVVPGNHDCDPHTGWATYDHVFPERRNYLFRHGGWQFLMLDTTQGTDWRDTLVSDTTLAGLDATVPTLDARAPTVIGTHFPLASTTPDCPVNAEAVLARCVGLNLREVFSGHYHGRTVAQLGACELVTNACVARVVNNHDGTKDKGYWYCRTRRDGTVTREFVLFAGVPAEPSPA